MLSGTDDPGESRMGEISMSGSTREREAAVIGRRAFHSVLSSLLYWFPISAFSFPLSASSVTLSLKYLTTIPAAASVVCSLRIRG